MHGLFVDGHDAAGLTPRIAIEFAFQGIKMAKHPSGFARKVSFIAAISCLGLGACGDDDPGPKTPLPYATSVERFSPGTGAGWGDDHFPEVVLGPPQGALKSGAVADADEVLSLGAGGEIVLTFAHDIVDGPGADFVVFENSFWVRNDPEVVWFELAEVSVSQDGESWRTFPCALEPTQPGQWPGCAGWSPTKQYNAETLVPLDPALTGGDAFDLAALGLKWARYVRIRDLLEEGNSALNNVGFDLDAVGVVHFDESTSSNE